MSVVWNNISFGPEEANKGVSYTVLHHGFSTKISWTAGINTGVIMISRLKKIIVQSRWWEIFNILKLQQLYVLQFVLEE